MEDERMTREELLRENHRLRAALDEARTAEASPPQGPPSSKTAPARRPDLFREAFRLGPAGQIVTRLSDGAVVEVNEQFAHLSGYERSVLVGHSSMNLGLWESERMRRVTIERLRGRGSILDVEFQLRNKSGSKRWMVGSCRLLIVDGEECMLVSCIDITARRRAESAERESQELFRRIFRVSPTGIALSRLADGHIVDVNPELCRLSGYERHEMLNTSIAELGLWPESPKHSELIERLRNDGVVHDFEFALYTNDGRAIDMLGSFQLLDVDGEDTVLSVLSDISARTRAEAALRRAKEEAEDLAQFRSSVIANMTHEVRTPLTVILGFTSMLRAGVSERYRRFVDLIERSGQRLLLTLDSVLDLAQLESGTLEVNRRPYNLVDVIDSVASVARKLVQDKELRFDLDLPSDRPLYANVDYELLTRALNHLIDNAIKFTDEGCVTLRLHTQEASGQNEAEDQVHIDVQDTGIGIEEDFRERLFHTFSQESAGLERGYQGAGMGLTVAGGLVERLGGEIRVESEKGTGSTFTIILPEVDLGTADFGSAGVGNGQGAAPSNETSS